MQRFHTQHTPPWKIQNPGNFTKTVYVWEFLSNCGGGWKGKFGVLYLPRGPCGQNHWKFTLRKGLCTCICFVGDLLRIGIPWDSSPFFTTMWADSISFSFSKHLTQIWVNSCLNWMIFWIFANGKWLEITISIHLQLYVFFSSPTKNQPFMDRYLEPQTTIFYWLFQLGDSKSLLAKWLFHQTSI